MQAASNVTRPAELPEELMTGIEALDAQHRYFFSLTEAVRRLPKDARADVIKGLLLEVVRYAQCHFAYEETLMAVYDYPDRQQHVDQHNIILEAFKLATSTEQINIAQARLQLIRWLHSHISLDDKPLADFVLANRPALVQAVVGNRG